MATINLKRPIIFFDLETTGVDVNLSKIVQACFIKILVDGQHIKKEYLVNPGEPIPAGASAVHGITDEMVKDKMNFGYYAHEIFEFIDDSDFAGFNSNAFDVPLLVEELFRYGINLEVKGRSFIDVRNMFVQLKPRTLGAAYQEYTGTELQNAHDAGADIEATISVFMAMIEKHQELPKTIEELSLFSNYNKPIVDLAGFFITNEHGVIIFAKGKHKGKVAVNEKNYLEWLIKEPSFPNNTKTVAREILKGRVY